MEPNHLLTDKVARLLTGKRLPHGQLNSTPCAVQGPRGPIKLGPERCSRAPSLSQQPLASQEVIMDVRGTVSAGGAGAAGSMGGTG